MDHYTHERLMLERRREVTRIVEARMRERGWVVEPRLSVRVAARLRMLADRLDRPEARPEAKLSVVSGSR